MRKILNNVLAVGFGIVVGSMFGLAVSFYMLKSSMMSVNEAYEQGQIKAQKECIDLIKNTGNGKD